MVPGDSEGKLSPLLLKRKADEKEVTIELHRLEEILDARINNLEVLTARIKAKTTDLAMFENTLVLQGFFSGQSTQCSKSEKLRSKIKKEIEELLEEELECCKLLDNAKKRFNEIQEELHSVFLSRKAVERLKDVRSSLSAVLRETEEDYGNEESFNQIKKDE
jgi:phosphomevalonate kinase